MARGDVGIAVAQAATRWALSPMMRGKNEVLVDKFLPLFCEDEPHLACFAITEQSSGCDIENLSVLHGKTIQTRAVLKGDEWIIRGSKRFARNSGVSKFERVLEYTGERVVAGKSIRNHSMGMAMLADMAIGIETAKAYYLQVAYMLDHPDHYEEASSSTMLSRASIAKVYATDTTVSIANKAMELMGSYGYMKNYHVEKYWRDSKEIQLWLGGPQLGRLDIARGYYDL